MKKCVKCGGIKSLEDFYTHPAMADGHLNKCKECTKREARENRANKVKYYREKDRERNQRPDRKECHRRYAKSKAGIKNHTIANARYRAANKEKYAAHLAVTVAIASGKLVNPGKCGGCGVVCRAEAHHPDYNKKLEVTWLCHTCHTDVHRNNFSQH